MLIYKIHPGIGVGRIGNSPDRFFVGPETPEHPGFEIQGDNSETSMAKGKYMDAAGKIKRQAVRFRVFEYDQDAAGKLTLKREITDNEAKITWRVDLVNRKAALDHAPPHNGIDPRVAAKPRNPTITGAARASLIIHDKRDQPISGKNQRGVFFDQGEFRGTKVFLGELQTDNAGRLLVLGGRGQSASADGKATTEFANNALWHDDLADGPVTAKIKFSGQDDRDVDASAWVTFAPPDFAPGISGIVTLHDVAFQAAIFAGFRKADAKASFRRHILPMIQRASNLRFVNDQSDPKTGQNIWEELPRDPVALGSTADDDASLRSAVVAVVAALTSPGIEAALRDAVIPAFLRNLSRSVRSRDVPQRSFGPLARPDRARGARPRRLGSLHRPELLPGH